MRLAQVLRSLVWSVPLIVAVKGAVIETSGVSVIRRDLPKLVTTSSTSSASSQVPSSTSAMSSSTEQPSSTGSSSIISSDSTSDSNTLSSGSSIASSTSAMSITSSDESSTSSTSSTSYSSYSSSTSSITPSPVYIPSAENNKYVYHVKQPSGTVYTAFGSCLGFILLVLLFVWLLFAFKSWKNARNEYQIRERENQYQYDPYVFQYGDVDGFSSDSDVASDISEKVLKQKSSRMSLYSLGGGSAFNLLSSEKVNEKPQQQTVNNPRLSMFISPTEILKNEGNNWSSTENSAFNSVASTPREQSMAQIINNPASKSSFNDNMLFENAVSKLQVQTTPDMAQLRPNDKKRKSRPPSAHLDQLLDGG
ncbi:Chitin synthase 3 complex protein CSI2 [Nakaseomyces bracarensis]|uniref:Chitin synthase 3 complex protein CSI2 n=1 Tax=Nakaseomyces bracarensis TaxID=273131 RepID=A0ABR4NTL2_9SACH